MTRVEWRANASATTDLTFVKILPPNIKINHFKLQAVIKYTQRYTAAWMSAGTTQCEMRWKRCRQSLQTNDG